LENVCGTWADVIKIDCKEIWGDFVDWINEGQGGVKWETFVNMGMNFRFRKYTVNFVFTIWAI
jgi:hypothetical protein